MLQVKELKLCDKWAESCIPSGGAVVNPDPVGRRNGHGNLCGMCGVDIGQCSILISSQ